MDLSMLQDLVIAIGLGLLVGLQREWRSERPAGIRTFALITLLGALCVTAGGDAAPWLVAAGLGAVTAVLWLGNWMAGRDTEVTERGITTEVAALVMFLVGVILARGHTGLAIVVTGATAVLLHWKDPMHAFVRRIGEDEFRAVIQFVLIALVLLPILPDKTYGPYSVLNPFKIWLMVTLIVGINLVSYVVHRAMGQRKGAVAGGVLGGMISSTATTVSHARRTRGLDASHRTAALVIVTASTVINLRVLVEIGVVGPGLLRQAVPPFLILALFMTAVCLVLARRGVPEETAPMQHRNPAQVSAALSFGVLFAAVIFVVAAVKSHFGPDAVYLVALVSGLTDVDAITLSAADLFQTGRLEAADAWRVVLVATLSNLAFKAGITGVFGTRALFREVAAIFAMTAALGVALILWWPDTAIMAAWTPAVE